MATLTELMDKDNRFLAAVGECITAWASIEQLVFDLFKVALDAEDELCAHLFWKFPTFSMRLSYTSALVRICLTDANANPSKRHPSNALKDWDKLNQRIADAYTFRNYVAHQPIPRNQVNIKDDGTINIMHAAVDQIYPNPDDPGKTFRPIIFEDLRSHIDETHHLRAELSLFAAIVETYRPLRFSKRPTRP